MMKKYSANLVLDNELTKVEFETKDNPIEYLWTRYGMDTYIESIDEVKEEVTIEEKNYSNYWYNW